MLVYMCVHRCDQHAVHGCHRPAWDTCFVALKKLRRIAGVALGAAVPRTTGWKAHASHDTVAELVEGQHPGIRLRCSADTRISWGLQVRSCFSVLQVLVLGCSAAKNHALHAFCCARC